MAIDKKNSSQREIDPTSVELLIKLREKLISNNISIARVAALNLSWKQDDGLTILKEALFGDYPRTTKKAAAYGLRSMNGRMKKLAIEVLEQGLNHRDTTTKAACIKSIALMKGEIKKGDKPASSRQRIRGIGANTSYKKKPISFNR